jgi:glycosyltransferase involved in cell wall biosynthesis
VLKLAMKAAIIIPYRNDRPEFLDNLFQMLKAQTFQNFFVKLINDEPLNSEKDITWRYRKGYEETKDKGFDVVFFMEVDDWYNKDYLQTMIDKWVEFGKPKLFGTNYTIYYHLSLRAWFTMHHTRRSSAMSTIIAPDLDINWCADNDPYTDVHLWRTIKGVTFEPDKHICLGIKHGIGLTGGRNHTDHLHRFINDDRDFDFLRNTMDNSSFDFYTNYFKK